MTSPAFLVYDADPANGINPYRPSLNDVGGGQKLDDSFYPPDPVTMPTAADFNEMGGLLVALGKVTPAAIILIANAGTASITALRAAGSVITALPVTIVGTGSTCGDFTVTRHAAGDVEIQCPATKLMQPFGALGFSQAAGDSRVSARLNGTGDGIRIETRNSSGALTDMPFLAFWE
jgi:hypothetical protein